MSDERAAEASYPLNTGLLREALGQIFPKRRVVVHRLILLIVLSSSVITLVATSLQLYFSYRGDVDRLYSVLGQVEQALLPSLSTAVWTFDGLQIQSQIDGWQKLRDVEFLKVSSGQDVWTAGAVATTNVITRDLEITRMVGGKMNVIGRVEITASLDKAVERVMGTALFIFASNGVKTLIMSLVILLIYHMLVTRHIFRMSRYIKGFSPERKFESLALDRPGFATRDADEIDDFARDISSMCFRLHNEFQAAERAVSQFRDYVEAASDWFWEVDANGNVSLISEGFGDMSGEENDDVLGKSLTELRWLGARTIQGRVATGRNGEPVPFHNLIDWRTFGDGQRHCIRSSGVPIFGPGGEFRGYRCVSVDITHEMMQRKELVARRKQFMESMHAMPHAIAWFDERDLLSYHNELFEQMQQRLLDRRVQGLSYMNFLGFSLAAGAFPDAKGREQTWMADRLDKHNQPGAPEILRIGQDGDTFMVFQEYRTPNGGTLLIIRDVVDEAGPDQPA